NIAFRHVLIKKEETENSAELRIFFVPSDSTDSRGMAHFEAGVWLREHQRYEAAFKRLKLAVDLKFFPALNDLGCHFLTGKGTEVNPQAAVACYREAAEYGHVNAMANLGLCYLAGVGVDHNQATGMKLLMQASARGSEPGRKRLSE